MATSQQDPMPLQPIHAKDACSVLSKKVLRAFACRVLSKKLGFTKDQISGLTDDEINDHIDRAYPRLSKAELEAELQCIAELTVTHNPEINDHMDREYPCLSKAELEAELQRVAELMVTHDDDFLFIGLKSLVSGLIAVGFAYPCIVSVGLILEVFFRVKFSESVIQTVLFTGCTFAFIGPLLVSITAKKQNFGMKGLNIKQEQPQPSKKCFTLSEYKYSTTPNLKGLKGLTW